MRAANVWDRAIAEARSGGGRTIFRVIRMANQIVFVSPPGWPSVPAGRLPAAGWTPPAGLPAAPAGWAFYRDQNGVPVTPPPGTWSPAPAGPEASVNTHSSAPMPPAAPNVPPPVTAAPTAQDLAGQPASSAAESTPAAPSAASGGKRLELVVAAIAFAVLVTLGVGGFFVYNALTAAPELTPAQFDRLGSVQKYGGQSVTLSESLPIGLMWLGAEEGDLPACQDASDFDNGHLMATYQGSTRPNGGVKGDVMFRLFGSKAEIATYQRLWAQCDAAAVAANIDDAGGKTGSTAGVAWERAHGYGLFWYGNVQVIAVKDFTDEAAMAAEASAIKATVDSLR
jgi:hypothetical protein